jgi:hypothetical protein
MGLDLSRAAIFALRTFFGGHFFRDVWMAALSPALNSIVGQQATNSDQAVLERRGTGSGNQPLNEFAGHRRTSCSNFAARGAVIRDSKAALAWQKKSGGILARWWRATYSILTATKIALRRKHHRKMPEHHHATDRLCR